MRGRPPRSPLVPYTTLCRSERGAGEDSSPAPVLQPISVDGERGARHQVLLAAVAALIDGDGVLAGLARRGAEGDAARSEEPTPELQSRPRRGCRDLRLLASPIAAARGLE